MAIGPNCIVQGPVTIGAGTKLIANVYLNGPLILGERNTFYPGACIGFAPQSRRYEVTEPGSGVVIGDDNTFRESVTIHRAAGDMPTRIGDDNFFMVNSHLGHDGQIGNHNTISNAVEIAGHVEVADRITLGGRVAIHQFCRIGRLAMIGGLAGVTQDVPPFCTMYVTRRVGSLNVIGLKRAGLDVRVKEGGPEKNAIKELELGYADFGVASADQVIRALDKGADVVVLAQLFQVNPMQWIYRADQPEITELEDLKGRNIGVTYGGNDETIMRTLLAKAGLTLRDVRISSVRFDFSPFLKKQVDIWPVYRNSQGVILEDKLDREGEAVRFFNPAEFGVSFVANSVVTSGKMMEKHPDRVRTFISALLAAWEFAMDPANADGVLAEIKKRDKGTQDHIRLKQLDTTRALVKPSARVKIGTIDRDAWIETESIMAGEKQIKGPVQVDTRLSGQAF